MRALLQPQPQQRPARTAAAAASSGGRPHSTPLSPPAAPCRPASGYHHQQRAATAAAAAATTTGAASQQQAGSAVVVDAPTAAAAAANNVVPISAAVAHQHHLHLHGVDEELREVLQAAGFEPGSFGERFTLTGEVLGQGTFGSVRACTERTSSSSSSSHSHATYAVKVLPRTRLGEDRTESIAREVAIWRRLATAAPDHVVGLVAAYLEPHSVYIVQELLTGGDLQAVIDEQGVLPEAVAAEALRGVLAAIAACHAAGVVYGDIKPSNAMLKRIYPCLAHRMAADPASAPPPGPMHLKLIDFGTSQYCPDGCSVIQGLSGTPVYIAPEVISRRCYGLAMDVWAAGVLAYHMLTGQFPFWDTDLAGIGRLHPRRVIEGVRDLEVLWDVPAVKQRLSPPAEQLLRGLLAKDPEARLTAAQALAHPWLQQPEQAQQN